MQKKIRTIDGMQISYLQKEVHENNKYLVFLHGWGQSKECFLPVIDENIKVNVVVIDLPGFGQSSEPEYYIQDRQTFITKQYANTIEKLLKEFGAKEIILVAHSYGARVSFWLANSSLPITKMLLTGAAGIKPKRTYKYYLSVYGYKFQKLLLKTPFYFQYKDDIISESGSVDYKSASQIMKQILVRSVNEDLKFLFSEINQKVVLFWGINDDQTPLKDALYMEEKLANSKLIKLQGSHFVFLEHKDLFKQEIKKIIK